MLRDRTRSTLTLAAAVAALAAFAITGLASAQSFRVITQDNLWFSSEPQLGNYELNGLPMIPFTPLLGLTASSDIRVKKQELQWLLRYTGRNGSGLVISQEWIAPGDLVDDNLRNTFLPVLDQYGRQTQWNIFYDPVLAALQRGLATAPPIDFGLPAIRQMWESDLQYFRDNYFSHPKYWKINTEPVLYVWNVGNGITNPDAAFQSAMNSGVYILADVQSLRINDAGFRAQLPPMDGATGFLVVTQDPWTNTTIGAVVPQFAGMFSSWNTHMAARGVDFIPAASAEYDDTEFKIASGASPNGNTEPLRILATTVWEVDDLLATARDAANPVFGVNYVFWGTANGWAEGTTILPTTSEAGQYYICEGSPCTRRIGDYGFTKLESLHRVLFPGERTYVGPLVTSGNPVFLSENSTGKLYRVKVDLEDADVMGTLRVVKSPGVTVKNPPDLVTGANLIERSQMRLRWRAKLRLAPGLVLNDVWTRVAFTNLDDVSTTETILGSFTCAARKQECAFPKSFGDDCCGTDYCASGGLCNACRGAGKSCNADFKCCSGDCSGGSCQ